MSLIIDEHRQYLSDVPRLTAYRDAINEVVRPGDVVLDLGVGTGIMGLLACRAGARRVYSIEADPIIGLTREICKANGFDDRITFIKGLSTQVDLPEKVDVVICDQIGRFGFEAGILEYFSDARVRFLKPGGALVPSRIDMYVVPVESERMYRQIDFWNNSATAFNLSVVRRLAANTGYPTRFSSDETLGSPVKLTSIDLAADSNVNFKANASSVVDREGVIHGIGGWFTAQLSPRVTVTNSSLAEQSINRRNVFLPIEQPVAVNPADRIEVAIRVIPSDSILKWSVKVLDRSQNEKASFVHSTWNGALVAKEDLARTQLHSIPVLTPRGQARLTVLSLCDGDRTLQQVEEETYGRHQSLFRTPDEAAVFVAEVVTRYSV